MGWLAIVLGLYLNILLLKSGSRLVFVMSVQFLADHAAFVETAVGAKAVRTVDSAAMGAIGAGGQGGFPVGTTVSLIGVTNTLLRNWHGENPLFDRICIGRSWTQIRSDDSYKKVCLLQEGNAVSMQNEVTVSLHPNTQA